MTFGFPRILGSAERIFSALCIGFTNILGLRLVFSAKTFARFIARKIQIRGKILRDQGIMRVDRL
jgi:hypothetical protein